MAKYLFGRAQKICMYQFEMDTLELWYSQRGLFVFNCLMLPLFFHCSEEESWKKHATTIDCLFSNSTSVRLFVSFHRRIYQCLFVGAHNERYDYHICVANGTDVMRTLFLPGSLVWQIR